jgi:hypothetical protein
MVARTKIEPAALVVTFTRDGEDPVRVEAVDGAQALLRAVALLLAHRRLQAGDRLLIDSANDPNG